ncbi:hypothetical protein Taro_053022 [Colocasia esculenta]|uniref:Uncharacterized protein n=1 Tax=Colocasia esculenta TaxID=4460 RepID=A0A843XK44_COLES|nr:hypothetical protein [Colocasia esculenta]
MSRSRGHLAVYVGGSRRRFVVPVSLKHASFQNLLRRVEEEMEFQHPMGGLSTIPCSEDDFVTLAAHLNGSSE